MLPGFLEQERTFDKRGGIMYSANCRDYLEVPVDAVDDVTMTECEPPYISRSDDSNDSYVGVFVKNYKQSGDNLFKRHVKIVSYYTLHNSKTSISSDDLRIRYSEKDGSFSYAKYNDYEANVYYTIDHAQNCVVIFTRHFSYYLIETNIESEDEIQFLYKKMERWSILKLMSMGKLGRAMTLQ
jgi:hypothetical protein